MRIKSIVIAGAFFLVGVGCGGYLFSKSLPRSYLPTSSCGDHCYSEKEIAGLVTSAALLRTPFLIPGVVLESDTCLSIRYPKPQARLHYVLFPKHDAKNIATLAPEDVPYVVGCFAMARELIERDRLQTYVVLTNGPGRQEIAYLHFHLIAE
jgi:diadenosine tetraphosphate (Ap4A) HIT family hydrolase